MSQQKPIYAKFQNKDIEENARWNVKKNFRLRKSRKINEDIMNRQLESFTTFEKFNESEGFDTVAEARDAIENVSENTDADKGKLEVSSLSVESERARLYGWTMLTILTLAGGIIITKM
jgi:hypothetical protein